MGKRLQQCTSEYADNSAGHKIYFFGGNIGTYDNTLYVFDTELMTWSIVPMEGQVPDGRAFHTSAVVGSKIYYFGGYNGNFSHNDLHIFDTGTHGGSHSMH